MQEEKEKAYMFSKAQENLEYVTVSSLLYVNIFEILPLQKKKSLE